VLLDLGSADTPYAAVTAISEQVRRIPHRGAGYGILRYLSGDMNTVSSLESMSRPIINFNYLGAANSGMALPIASIPNPEKVFDLLSSSTDTIARAFMSSRFSARAIERNTTHRNLKQARRIPASRQGTAAFINLLLALYGSSSDRRLAIRFQYNPAVYATTVMEHLADMYLELLGALITPCRLASSVVDASASLT
jgi:non-ribosomal peptide synthase protein (TIGR01720 family)